MLHSTSLKCHKCCNLKICVILNISVMLEGSDDGKFKLEICCCKLSGNRSNIQGTKTFVPVAVDPNILIVRMVTEKVVLYKNLITFLRLWHLEWLWSWLIFSFNRVFQPWKFQMYISFDYEGMRAPNIGKIKNFECRFINSENIQSVPVKVYFGAIK